VQLYKRLALEDDQTDHREMLRGLEEAIGEAQRTLRHVVVAGGTGAAAADSTVASYSSFSFLAIYSMSS
jgi:molybdopterin biosynthesis enzyme MoaB